jgi:hypothetical protein
MLKLNVILCISFLLIFSSDILETKPTHSEIENQLYEILNLVLEENYKDQNTDNFIKFEEPYTFINGKIDRKLNNDYKDSIRNNKRNAYRNFSKGLYSDMLRKLAQAG